MVATSFRCIPQLGLIYLYNPKVACTTIQYSVWAAADAKTGVKTQRIRPHRRDEGPFIRDIFRHPLFGSPDLRAMTCFAVVRNPFLRILSGYLNKIVNRTPVWRPFAEEHGLDFDAGQNQVSFTDFLRIIETDCDETLNVHFRPQYARKARQHGEESLATAIEERIRTLNSAWREQVKDNRNFVPAKEERTRSERRARRLEKRDPKRKAGRRRKK